jgi:hypothetical protein
MGAALPTLFVWWANSGKATRPLPAQLFWESMRLKIPLIDWAKTLVGLRPSFSAHVR